MPRLARAPPPLAVPPRPRCWALGWLRRGVPDGHASFWARFCSCRRLERGSRSHGEISGSCAPIVIQAAATVCRAAAVKKKGVKAMGRSLMFGLRSAQVGFGILNASKHPTAISWQPLAGLVVEIDPESLGLLRRSPCKLTQMPDSEPSFRLNQPPGGPRQRDPLEPFHAQSALQGQGAARADFSLTRDP